jgi:hypothetical protein
MSCAETARNCMGIVARGLDRLERELRLAKEARAAMRDAIKKTPVNYSKQGAYLEPDTKEKRGKGRISDEAIEKLRGAWKLGYNQTKCAAHAGCVSSTARRYLRWMEMGKL